MAHRVLDWEDTKDRRPKGEHVELVMANELMLDQKINRPGIARHGLSGKYFVWYRHPVGPCTSIGYFKDYEDAVTAYDDFVLSLEKRGPKQSI